MSKAIKTQIVHKAVDWIRVKNACRTTVGKDESEIEATPKFKKALLISQHSPIRLLTISWKWDGIKSWVATHWSRHKWECFISTQRTDRTGVNRDESPQGELVKFEGEANTQHLIDTAKVRLCYCASLETRVQMEDLKITLHKDEEVIEVADVLVPSCIYRMGCPEKAFTECKFFDGFMKKHGDKDLTDIQTRYNLYNTDFYKRLESNHL